LKRLFGEKKNIEINKANSQGVVNIAFGSQVEKRN
jgi:hypothetical protein